MGDSANSSQSGDLSWNLPEHRAETGDEEKSPRSKRGDDVFQTGTVIEGRYKLYKRLGKGAVGTVWEAYDQKLARPVALKLIRTDCDAEMADRFVREAKAAAALQTVHVVAVYDNGVHQGVPYIVMERLEGETVSDVFERHGQLRMEQVASLLVQCTAALRCAHERGIIHRDLKPANLFVSTSEDGYETLKLLDFGVAKQPDDARGEATESGVILGTPHYMSPEQARAHKDLDHRSDVWSMAVILYRALTGERPFSAEAAVDVLVKIVSEKPKDPSVYRKDLPKAVDAFFARAFAKKVDDRFQSVVELRDAFMKAAEIEPSSLRDAEHTALTTGSFVAWESGSDIPRPRLSDGGLKAAPSVPSISGVKRLAKSELGTLSASTSVHDFELAARSRKRSRLAAAGVVVLLVGGVIATVVIGGIGESEAPVPEGAPNHQAAPAEQKAPSQPVSAAGSTAPSAPSASVKPETKKPPSRPIRKRGFAPGKPAPAPTPSPKSKGRLPLY